jgi:hypothetical protein
MASSATEYGSVFFRVLGRECYRTWRRDLLASFLLYLCSYSISAVTHDTLAWPTFKLALESTLLVLVIYAAWHLLRTPYLVHLDTMRRVGQDNKRRTQTEVAPPPNLNLRLTPHGDNSPQVVLEVLNQGDTVNLSAQLRITGVSTRRLFKTYPFNGQWKSELTSTDFYNQQSESYVENVRLEPQRSRLLKIASIASLVYGQQEMELFGIDEESVKWDSDPRQNQELPYFIVQITLIAKGYSEVVNVTYKIGPKTTLGPFQMTEITV